MYDTRMPTFQLRKLVRDGHIAHYREAGQVADYRQLDKKEHILRLIDKIAEEIREVAASDTPADELADAQQALDDLATLLGEDRQSIAAAQARKLANNGGFGGGYYVESLYCDEADEWTAYYRREPDRFPEIS